jgi:hypothetical protein
LCNFKTNYKNSFINDTEDPLDWTTTPFTSNLLYLIESISTLTYLIELNSDLQQIAGYLEQILPTLIQNILYSFSNILTFRKKIAKLDPRSLNNFYGFAGASSPPHHRRPKAINKTTNSSLFSLFYLVYNQFTSKGIHLKLNQHQYDLHGFTFSSSSSSSSSDPLNQDRRCVRFFKMFEINLYKYLISVSLHLMASLASNNEESRRQLTENSELINKIVELIQLKSNKFSNLGGSSSISDSVEVNMEDVRLNEMLENDDCDFDDLLVEYDEEADIAGEDQSVASPNSPPVPTQESSAECDMDCSKQTNSSLTDSNLLRLSSLCLLHSLSRSVHQLRTKFLDNKLWNTIVELINKIYVKRLKLNEMNGKNNKSDVATAATPASNKSDDLSVSYASGAAGIKLKSANEKNVSNEEDDEDLLLMANEIDEMEYESDLADFSLNEKNLIAILFALVANLVIDFSPCKEVCNKTNFTTL